MTDGPAETGERQPPAREQVSPGGGSGRSRDHAVPIRALTVVKGGVGSGYRLSGPLPRFEGGHPDGDGDPLSSALEALRSQSV